MIRPRRAPLPFDVGNHYDEIDFFYRELWGEHFHHGLWLDGSEDPLKATEQLLELATETEYRNWITQAGLEDVRVTDLSSQVSRTWSVIAVRVIRELLRPRAWRYLTHQPNRNRRFLLSIFRIRLAYGTGAFRYLLLAARRPKENRRENTLKA